VKWICHKKLVTILLQAASGQSDTMSDSSSKRPAASHRPRQEACVPPSDRRTGSLWRALIPCLLLAWGLAEGVVTLRAAEPLGRKWFVATNGNDNLALPDDPTRPFQTIQSALAQAGNGDTVLVRPGRYVVTPGFPADPLAGGVPPLIISHRVDFTLSGEGDEVEILGEGRGDSLMIADSTNIVVRNLVFRGNRPEVEPSDVPFVFPSLLLYGYNTNVLIRGCQFRDFGNHGISHLYDPKASEAVTVMDCRFENGGDLDAGGIGEEGAAVSGIGSGWVITNNVVVNCVRGFEVEGNAPTAVSNVVIRGNFLTNCTNLGVMVFANSGEAWRYRNILIADNHIYATYRSFNSTAVPILVTGGEDILISNNVVRACSDIGIAANAHFSDLSRCVVASNIVEQSGTRGIQSFQFGDRTARDVKVIGNVVRFSGDSGILVEGIDMWVEGNECQGNAAFSKRAGIELSNVSGRAGRMVVNENYIWAHPAYSYQDYGIWIREGVVGAVVTANQITSHPAARILNEGVDTDFGAIPRPAPAPHVLPQAPDASQFPMTLSETGLFSTSEGLRPADGLYPYGVNVPERLSGARVQHWVRAPDFTSQFRFSESNAWNFPPGTLWVQHFTLQRREGIPESSFPVETRVLVLTTNTCYGLSYRWDEAGKNATLVPSEGDASDVSLDAGGTNTVVRWRFPSRQDCATCHNAEAGHALGFNTAQLNREEDYESGRADQLRVLGQASFLDQELKVVSVLPKLVPPTDAFAPVESRVHSYLAANCAGCHRPSGPADGAWDARFSTPLMASGLIRGQLASTQEQDPELRLVVPGSLPHSELHRRLTQAAWGHALTALQSSEDPEATSLVARWITETMVRPVVESQRAVQINARLALATASLNPNTVEGPVRAWFEWGTSTQYGEITAPLSLAAGTNATGVGWFLLPLTPETIYHFRVVASNAFGLTYGNDSSFISARNHEPVAHADSLTARKHFPLSFNVSDLLTNDTDPDYGDVLTFSRVDPVTARGGSVERDGAALRYRAPDGLEGTDEFYYDIEDLSGASARARVSISIVVTNMSPLPQRDVLEAIRNAALQIDAGTLLSNDNDPDEGDRLTIASVTPRSQAGGKLVLEGSMITYTPPLDYEGPDRFGYSVVDLGGALGSALVDVTVLTDYQDPRISALVDAEILEDTKSYSQEFQISVDPRAPNLAIMARSSNPNVLPETHLWFNHVGSSWRLELFPPANRNGQTIITLRVSDGPRFAESSFLLTLLPVDDPPVAGSDSLFAESGRPLRVALQSLLANDSDPDPGTVLSVSGVDPASVQGGTIDIQNDTLVYLSAPGFAGADSFHYIVRDPSGLTAQGLVSVTVEPAFGLVSMGLGADGRLSIRWTGVPGRAYRLQATEDLTQWTDLQDIVATSDGGLTFEEAASRPARFYRLVRTNL
jgi:mono/diheme cytochrome c family protein